MLKATSQTPPHLRLRSTKKTHWVKIQQSLSVRSGPQEDAVPALMTLKRVLTLLLLMASRQAEITWFLGFPTGHNERKQIQLRYRSMEKSSEPLEGASRTKSPVVSYLLVCPLAEWPG